MIRLHLGLRNRYYRFKDRLYRRLCNLLPINRQKIVFQNFCGGGFGCNPKAIAIALHRLDPTLDLAWLVKKPSADKPEWLREVVGYHKQLKELSTACVWVDNQRCGLRTKKRKGQFFVQTWHGSIALKRIEGDVEEHLPAGYIATVRKDPPITDLMISNSKWCTEMYRRAFWYKGRVLECGSPRCDILINNPHGTGTVHRYFNLQPDVKLAIYAPTFRADFHNAYDVDFKRLLGALREKFGSDMKLVIRMHPNVHGVDFGFSYDDDFLNGTDYPDMYELLAECDVEVNDYSCTMFEMGLAKKPVFLYAHDIEEYKADRGFYFDITSLPFPLATTNDELIRNIEKFDYVEYWRRVDTFMESFGAVETGHAAEDVAKEILRHINHQ